MDGKTIINIAERLKRDIEREVMDRLPRKVGIIARNHFMQNFRDAGWRDGGLHQWKRTQRQDSDSPDARYTPLTSRRDHLMRSIDYRAGQGEVTIENPVPYAGIHNEGGTVTTHPSVTDKMRRFAWAMAYKAAGVRGKGKLPKELTPEAERWRAMALTKKNHLIVHAEIPQRQFMGEGQELMEKVEQAVQESIDNITEKAENGITNL